MIWWSGAYLCDHPNLAAKDFPRLSNTAATRFKIEQFFLILKQQTHTENSETPKMTYF